MACPPREVAGNLRVLLHTILRSSASLLLAVAISTGARAEDLETVELVPRDRAGWSPAAIFSPITSLFRGGPAHWFNPREIVIRTTPPGAGLDFSYVRRSFQKGFEQGDAPCRLVLPSPSEAGEYDIVKIRAFLDGYQQKEVSVPVRSRVDELLIELDPLSNSLVAATHLYFAGRASIGFVTKEAVVPRNQAARDGFSLILLKTGATPDALESLANVRNPLIASLRPQQLGEDLVIQFKLTERADPDHVRNLQTYDAVRRVHLFKVDVEPKGGAGDAVQRSIDALARVRPGDVSGCALRFEDELRARLQPSALADALDVSNSQNAKYLRAAMRRLGELSPGGAVTLTDGTTYRTALPLELSAAMSQAADVRGYLVMLRAFIAELESQAYRRETLRGMLAPELPPERFAKVFEAGAQAEAACRVR